MTAPVPDHAALPASELRSMLRSSPALEVRTWRFAGNSIAGEGWFVAFVDSTGALSVQSDYGDYSNYWNRRALPTNTVLQFFATVGADYLLSKVSRADWLDLEASKLAARRTLVEARRDLGRAISREEKERADEIRAAWDALDDVQGDQEWHDFLMHDGGAVQDGELWQCEKRDYSPRARAFIAKTWPRIVEQVKEAVERGEGPR